MMVNLLDDSNFHRQTAVMTRLIEMIIQNPVFWDLLHHIDVGSSYFAMFDEFHQHIFL
jgi:hypothetical protein